MKIKKRDLNRIIKNYLLEGKKKKEVQGTIILCHWRGSKPVSKGMDEGIPKTLFERVFPQGHGGIILIRPGGEADYFDFGRYKDPQWNHCSEKEYEKMRDIREKIYQKIPGLRGAIAIPGVIRHKSLEKANLKEYKPSVIFDPVKSGKKHILGMEMNTVSVEEAKKLVEEAQELGGLSDGECFICPDVGYVDVAYNFALQQMKKCHLYSLIPVTNNYNCGTFATHLAFIAGKGRGLRQGFWQTIQTLMDPTTQPADLIPHVANLTDYTDKFIVP